MQSEQKIDHFMVEDSRIQETFVNVRIYPKDNHRQIRN